MLFRSSENASHPVLTAVGAVMPTTYKATKYDSKTGRNIEQDKDLDVRLLLNHNTYEIDGKKHISLSDMDTMDMVDRIADLYSQGMNGTVDVEKDPWVFLIQANLQVAPIMLYLFKAGVPVREALYFIAQPLVREYVRNQKIIGGAYGLMTGKAAPDITMVKYKAAKQVIGENARPLIESKLIDPDGGFITDTVNVRYTTESNG